MSSFPTTVLYIRPGDHREVILRQLAITPKDQRVLLVFPTRLSSRMNLLDFRLLARQAEQGSIQLAVATRNPFVQSQAESAGLMVFPTIVKARQHSWFTANNEKHSTKPDQTTYHSPLPATPPKVVNFGSRTHQWWEWLAFLSATAAMLGIILYLTSSAEITIPLQKETQTLLVTFEGGAEVLTANLAGQFPIHELNVLLESEGSAPATGSENTPQDYAHGIAILSNLTSASITIPQGLVLTTLGESPIRFSTTQSITLPAYATEGKEVPVVAVLPGAQGNVSANAIQAIEGNLGASLSVSNDSPTFGGTDTQSSVPTDNDIALLKTELLKELDLQAEQVLNAQLNPESESLVENSITQSEIIMEEIATMPGTDPQEFTLSLRVWYSAQMVSTDDLTNVAEQLLNMSIPTAKKPLENTLRINPIASPVMQGDEVFWEVILQQQTQDQIDADMLASFAGKPRAQLLHWLDMHVSMSGNPTIQTTPRGWLWLPVFINNMEIILL